MLFGFSSSAPYRLSHIGSLSSTLIVPTTTYSVFPSLLTTCSSTSNFDLSVKPSFKPILAEIGSPENKGVLVLNPIIKEGSVYKKVISFTYSFQEGQANRINNQNVIQSTSNSVLATGNWHRFYVEKSGVYKVSKSFLQSIGFNVNVDPRNIKIYGNGGRMLPLENTLPYPNDLEENAIQFVGEDDGVFDNSDYILF